MGSDDIARTDCTLLRVKRTMSIHDQLLVNYINVHKTRHICTLYVSLIRLIT
jgi:hypothetical protein